MATLEEWQNALTAPAWLNVVSPQVIKDVETRLKKTPPRYQPKLNLSAVSIFTKSRVCVTPSNILHAIGKATTPAVPNLTALSTTWAEIRYVWAFDPARTEKEPPLRLSEEARSIDFHQKALLSDEVGVGVATLLMEQFGKTSRYVHISEASRKNKFGLHLDTRLSPDYVFYGPSGPLFIVECKGTRSGYRDVIRQLAHGSSQVASVAFSPKPSRAISKLVVCTHMEPSGATVYAIDPPDSDGPEDMPTVIDPRLLDSYERSAKLAFAGDYVSAVRQLPPDLRERYLGQVDPNPRLTTIEIRESGELQGASFAGSIETRRTLDGMVLEMFRGLETQQYDTYRRLQSPEAEPVLGWSHENGYVTLRVPGRRRSAAIRSVARDGTMFQIRLRPR